MKRPTVQDSASREKKIKNDNKSMSILIPDLENIIHEYSLSCPLASKKISPLVALI